MLAPKAAAAWAKKKQSRPIFLQRRRNRGSSRPKNNKGDTSRPPTQNLDLRKKKKNRTYHHHRLQPFTPPKFHPSADAGRGTAPPAAPATPTRTRIRAGSGRARHHTAQDQTRMDIAKRRCDGQRGSTRKQLPTVAAISIPGERTDERSPPKLASAKAGACLSAWPCFRLRARLLLHLCLRCGGRSSKL